MHTSLTLYQLSYQEIWWVDPRILRYTIFFLSPLPRHMLCVLFLGKGRGDTPYVRTQGELDRFKFENFDLRVGLEPTVYSLIIGVNCTQSHMEFPHNRRHLSSRHKLFIYMIVPSNTSKTEMYNKLTHTTSWILVWSSTNWAIRRCDKSSFKFIHLYLGTGFVFVFRNGRYVCVCVGEGRGGGGTEDVSTIHTDCPTVLTGSTVVLRFIFRFLTC